MRDHQHASLGLSGSLLIAHPNLLDPNFRRTILYIVDHDPVDGAYGLVLNQEATDANYEVVAPHADELLARVRVFHGGPVGQERLAFAAFRWRTESQSIECRPNLDIEDARDLALDADVEVRAFIGYAGWTGGQLESELQQKAWLVQKPDRDILDPEACKQMWFTIMQNYGPWFRLLAAAPDDPAQN